MQARGIALQEAVQRRWQRWLQRRIPPARRVTLDQRRVFIFPSATGFFFMLALLVMLIAAINYQNNTSYALTFLLANLFVIAVLHSYANLSGLTITALEARDAFPGQHSVCRLSLEDSRGREHIALRLGWPEPGRGRAGSLWRRLFSTPGLATQAEVDVERGGREELRLYPAVGERGWFRPGRLYIESVYPLGLLRCWTWIDLDLQALVFPAPQRLGDPAGAAAGEGDGLLPAGSGDDEFAGLRDYRSGDNPRRVFWKGLARGQDLQSKEFAAYAADERWLDWASLPALPTEQRLSALCYWALDYRRRDLEYGLRLPGTTVEPGRGEPHTQRVLRALALHGFDAPESAA